MPLTLAEKQRRFRPKSDADPTKRTEYLRKGRDKWKKYREDGVIKYAQAMTKRESRHNRTKWRLSKRQTRASAKLVDAQITPPRSPGSPQPGPSSQARRGRKRVTKNSSVFPRECIALLPFSLPRTSEGQKRTFTIK